jgi:ubiquinone biosynthesis protein UbiJ
MQTLIISLLKKAINQYVLLDPESRARLEALEDKVINLELLGIGITLQLHFSKGNIEISKDAHLPAHTYIKGTPLSLVRMALTKDNRNSFFADDLSVEGDLELAEEVIELFDHLEIDWEEYTSRWLGDVAAHQLGRFVRGIRNFNQRANETLLQNVNEYVHEEVKLCPAKEEIEDFFKEIDEIRMAVDRMEARVGQCKTRIKNAIS